MLLNVVPALFFIPYYWILIHQYGIIYSALTAHSIDLDAGAMEQLQVILQCHPGSIYISLLSIKSYLEDTLEVAFYYWRKVVYGINKV